MKWRWFSFCPLVRQLKIRWPPLRAGFDINRFRLQDEAQAGDHVAAHGPKLEIVEAISSNGSRNFGTYR